MNISNPRRILLLSQHSTPINALLKDLNILPSSPQSLPTAADTQQQLYSYSIKTAYYEALVPVWCDTIADAEAWKQEWTSTSEAGEVIRAVGAWVVVFEKPVRRKDLEKTTSLLSTIHAVITHHTCSPSGTYDAYDSTDSVFLAIGLPQSITPSLVLGDEEWEDICRENGGWEWIDGAIKDIPKPGSRNGEKPDEERNEYGETIGLARVREALEANDWDSFTADLSSSADGNIDLHELGLASGDEDDDHDRDFSVEVAEPESSMSQMRTAILDPSNEDTEEDTKDQRQERPEEEEVYGEGIGHVTSGMRDGNGNATSDEDQKMQEEAESEDEDIQVGELESMMLKMQAIKDMTSSLPPTERKRFAAKAVRDVLKI